MSWIRDNILKLAIILIIIIIAIVVVSLLSNKGETKIETATGYKDLEIRMQDAAIKYGNDHKDILPTSKDKTLKIKLSTLVDNNYIGEIHDINNSSTVCTGDVTVTLFDEKTSTYYYVPHLICGNNYETKSINEQIMATEKIVSEGDGLYKVGNEYVYKGDYPNNFLKLGDYLYRIISITPEGDLKVITTGTTVARYVWDDRYNSEVQDYIGINNYTTSRMKDNLQFLYENKEEKDGEIYFTDEEREFFMDHEFCIGKVDLNSTLISQPSECAEKITSKVGLLNLSDYYKASTSPLCNELGKSECNNYNYLYAMKGFILMNADSTNTYNIFRIRNGIIEKKKAVDGDTLYLTAYVEGTHLYASGTGTEKDPYVIR